MERTAQFTQIAATLLSDNSQSFSVHMLTTERISPGACCATGLSITSVAGRRTLVAHGKIVDSLSQKDGLESFPRWLESSGGVLLVAYNCLTFDMRVLTTSLLREGLFQRTSMVSMTLYCC